jgi:hypothetical protein
MHARGVSMDSPFSDPLGRREGTETPRAREFFARGTVAPLTRTQRRRNRTFASPVARCCVAVAHPAGKYAGGSTERSLIKFAAIFASPAPPGGCALRSSGRYGVRSRRRSPGFTRVRPIGRDRVAHTPYKRSRVALLAAVIALRTTYPPHARGAAGQGAVKVLRPFVARHGCCARRIRGPFPRSYPSRPGCRWCLWVRCLGGPLPRLLAHPTRRP